MRQENIEITLEHLLDRERIRHVFARYSRGMDRQDGEILASAYWPDGWDDHGVFAGTPAEFVSCLEDGMWKKFRMVHLTGQSYIEIHGSFANAETYYIAYHREGPDDDTCDMFQGGRYVDRLEKRGEEWRLLHRTAVYEWTRDVGASNRWDTRWYRGVSSDARSRAKTSDDYSWELFVNEPLERGSGKSLSILDTDATA